MKLQPVDHESCRILKLNTGLIIYVDSKLDLEINNWDGLIDR